MAIKRDIFALAAGYYPIIGELQSETEIHEKRNAYGIGRSAATVSNYKLFAGNQTSDIRETDLPGNITTYGKISDDKLGGVHEQQEVGVESYIAGADPDNFLKEVYREITQDYTTELQEAARAEKSLKGRSLEEMPIEGLSDTTEKQMRKDMVPSTANPPDLPKKVGTKTWGYEVSRQALGTRGHAYQGSVVPKLAQKLKEAKEEHDGDAEATYNKMALAGLDSLQQRYRGWNKIIEAVVTVIEGKGKRTKKQFLKETERMLRDPKGKDPKTLARNLAVKESKSKAGRLTGVGATNYATDEALRHINHNIAFSNPLLESLVLDPGIFAEYGPIKQNLRGKSFLQFQTDEIKSKLIMNEYFAGDTVLDFSSSDITKDEAARIRFSSHSNKFLARQGQTIDVGDYLKSQVGFRRGKLVPSVAVTQANEDFNEVISRQLYPNLGQIANEFLNKPHVTKKLGMLINKFSNSNPTDDINDNTMWAQPYVSVMTFQQQAYAPGPASLVERKHY